MSVSIGTSLENLRQQKPLVHCITNYVTVNDVANALLAVGASPIMADAPEEVAEVVAHCQGLDINIGTLHADSVRAMKVAGQAAMKRGLATVLDPVGVGVSQFRQQAAQGLMQAMHFTAIRGNASELGVLFGLQTTPHGVDVAPCDVIGEENLAQGINFVKAFAKKYNTLAVMTGAIDLVADARTCYVIRNGRPEMGKVTGTGCQLSGILTAFLAANPKQKLEAAASAVCMMGLAGELAYKSEQGNATYRTHIIDALCQMQGAILDKGANYEIH